MTSKNLFIFTYNALHVCTADSQCCTYRVSLSTNSHKTMKEMYENMTTFLPFTS